MLEQCADPALVLRFPPRSSLSPTAAVRSTSLVCARDIRAAQERALPRSSQRSFAVRPGLGNEDALLCEHACSARSRRRRRVRRRRPCSWLISTIARLPSLTAPGTTALAVVLALHVPPIVALAVAAQFASTGNGRSTTVPGFEPPFPRDAVEVVGDPDRWRCPGPHRCSRAPSRAFALPQASRAGLAANVRTLEMIATSESSGGPGPPESTLSLHEADAVRRRAIGGRRADRDASSSSDRRVTGRSGKGRSMRPVAAAVHRLYAGTSGRADRSRALGTDVSRGRDLRDDQHQ